MQVANPQMELSSSKHQTIEQYINQNLQLKTLKIKKFQFQESFSCEIKPSKKLKNSLTTRERLDIRDQRYQNATNGWEPKLSHRRLMKEPKILLSVERRKIKTSQSIRKANQVFSTPKSRIGFRGQKVRSHSFFIEKPEQKVPKKLVIQTKHYSSQKKHKPIPNFHFNFKYVIEQRKKGKQQLTRQQLTKKGSNNGYFAFFGSDNFTKYLQSKSSPIKENAYHPNSNRLSAKAKNAKEQISMTKSIHMFEQ